MGDCMTFPKTAGEFIEQYSFKDEKQEYTNGAELIPVFRVEQMIEHYFSTKAVRGRWVQKEYWPGGGTWRCSECGYQVMFMEATPETKRMYYCPNCGAKMDGDGNV